MIAEKRPVKIESAPHHILSLDMAKEISMIQRTEKGKQARQYFIECERYDGTYGTSYTTMALSGGINFIRKKLGIDQLDTELALL